MRKGLLLLSFIIASYATVGQPLPDQLYAHTRQDTIRAIQRLFAERRQEGNQLMTISIPLTLAGSLAAFLGSAFAALVTLGQTKRNIVPVTVGSGAVGLIPAALGLNQHRRFSRRREDALIDAYTDSIPLPPRIRRKLKPRYFSADEFGW